MHSPNTIFHSITILEIFHDIASLPLSQGSLILLQSRMICKNSNNFFLDSIKVIFYCSFLMHRSKSQWFSSVKCAIHGIRDIISCALNSGICFCALRRFKWCDVCVCLFVCASFHASPYYISFHIKSPNAVEQAWPLQTHSHLFSYRVGICKFFGELWKITCALLFFCVRANSNK